jgi:trigger factor
VREKRRGAIAEKLISEAKFDVPEVFIESELETMIGQFKADIVRNGLTFDGYLSSIKKTEADIKTEWRESAERRARLELILKYIAQAEKITPDEAEVKKEVDHIISHHKGADRFSIRMYVENMMKNKLVLDFLEKGSEKSKK